MGQYDKSGKKTSMEGSPAGSKKSASKAPQNAPDFALQPQKIAEKPGTAALPMGSTGVNSLIGARSHMTNYLPLS